MKVLFSLFCFFLLSGVSAQVKDSFAAKKEHVKQIKKDTGKKNAAQNITKKDSVKKPVHVDSARAISTVSVPDSVRKNKASIQTQDEEKTRPVFARKPLSKKEALFFYLPERFYHKGVYNDTSLVTYHNPSGTSDIVFYCLLVILFFTGVVRASFPKYFKHLFQFILQPGLRKRNLKEGVSTDSILPAILFNIIFIITASLYIVLPGNTEFTNGSEKMYWIYCAIALLCIYLIKFAVVKLSGWIFNVPNAANIYNYVVFSINKIAGLFLIPVIIFMVYGSASFAANIYSGSIFIIIGLLIYRYVVSFILLRGELKVSVLHFFLYLCAIEILPLLIIYKILLMNFGKII